MSEDVTFRGISRFKLIHFLSLLSNKYDGYRQQQIREWHLERDLDHIKALSKDMKDGEELLFLIKDVESKLVRFFGSETNLPPQDKKLLKNLHHEITHLNTKLMHMDKNGMDSDIVKKQQKIAAEINKLNEKILEEESNLGHDIEQTQVAREPAFEKPKQRKHTHARTKPKKSKGKGYTLKDAQPKATVEIHEINSDDLEKEDKKTIPKHHKAAAALKDSITEFKNHKEQMRNKIRTEHKEKIIFLEKKYNELKDSPYVKKDQLNLIKDRIDKLKSEIA
jgi:hypothetical protein